LKQKSAAPRERFHLRQSRWGEFGWPLRLKFSMQSSFGPNNDSQMKVPVTTRGASKGTNLRAKKLIGSFVCHTTIAT
jgi:hypothetical protein